MSWIVRINRTGEHFETFDRDLVRRIDRQKCTVEPAGEYLARINERSRNRPTNARRPGGK